MASRLGRTLPLAAAILAIGAGTASAATRYVDNTPSTPCKKNLVGAYGSIQDAVDDAKKNDTIVVCQGVYYENVHISTDGLKLQGQYKNGEVLKPLGYAPGIHIEGAKNVQVTKLVIQGGGSVPSLKARKATAKARASAVYYDAVGILVNGGARNARLSFNRVLDTFNSCCIGLAKARASDVDSVLSGGIVFGGDGDADPVTGPGSGIAHDNEVTGYDGAGIVAFGAGSVVNLTRNRVTATGGLRGDSMGILAFGAAKVTALANNVANNDAGFYIGDVAPGSQFNSNVATNNWFGYYLESVGASLKGNAAVDGGYGFFASGFASGNTLKANKAHEAQEYDCIDQTVGAKTAGTANTWIANKGAAASPDPICN